MSTSPGTIDRRSGLVNVIDIVIAPNAAFERLRQVPLWGWAFLVASLLAIAGSLLVEPAILHALDKTLPAQYAANPQIAKLPPEKQQKFIEQAMGIARLIAQLSWLFAPIAVLFVGLLQGLIMTVANAIAHGKGTFARYFALSVTVAVVGYGISALVMGVIVALRGASAFEDPAAIQAVVPGLGMLAPGAPKALATFLQSFNVFSVWATALLALGMVRVGNLKPPAAWTTAILMLLFGALTAAGFAAYGAAHGQG